MKGNVVGQGGLSTEDKEKLIPENIKAGVTIGDVDGTLEADFNRLIFDSVLQRDKSAIERGFKTTTGATSFPGANEWINYTLDASANNQYEILVSKDPIDFSKVNYIYLDISLSGVYLTEHSINIGHSLNKMDNTITTIHTKSTLNTEKFLLDVSSLSTTRYLKLKINVKGPDGRLQVMLYKMLLI